MRPIAAAHSSRCSHRALSAERYGAGRVPCSRQLNETVPAIIGPRCETRAMKLMRPLAKNVVFAPENSNCPPTSTMVKPYRANGHA